MLRFFGKKDKYDEPSVRYSALLNRKRSSESDDEEDRKKQQEPTKRPKNSVSDDEEGPSSSSQPSTSQPSTWQPSTSQPSTSQPSTSRPSTSRPSTSRPSTSRPSTSQPSTSAGSSNFSPELFTANMIVTVSDIQTKGKREEYVVVTIVDGVAEPYKVFRQYSEFQELDRRLKMFKETGHVVPDLPAEQMSSYFVRFFKGFVKRTTAQRCESMTEYMRAIVKNDLLRGDEDVLEFLTKTDPFQMLMKAEDTGVFKIARYAVEMFDRINVGAALAVEAKAFREQHYFAGDFDACVKDLRAADTALRKARLTITAENEDLAKCFKNLGIVEKDSKIVRESFFARAKYIQDRSAIERKYFESGDDKISKAFESHIKAMTELKELYDLHKQMQRRWANAAKLFKDCIRTDDQGDAYILQADVEKLDFRLQDIRAEFDLVLKNIPIETERVKNISAQELKEELVKFGQKFINVQKETLVVHDRYKAELNAINAKEDTVPERMNEPLHRYN